MRVDDDLTDRMSLLRARAAYTMPRNTIVAVVLLFREGRTTPYPRHTVRVRVRVRVVVVVLVSVVIDA